MLKRFHEAVPDVERRDVGEGVTAPVVSGHAVVFDSWATIYDGTYYQFREVIRPGAFADALREDQDVRLLFNHDSNFVLARTKSSTLTLREDAKGLAIEAELLDSPTVNDLVLGPMRRGDITGMSFAFRVRDGGETTKETTRDGKSVIERELTSLDLYDVSIVTYPAYEATSVDVRSLRDREAALIAKRHLLLKLDARLRLAEAS